MIMNAGSLALYKERLEREKGEELRQKSAREFISFGPKMEMIKKSQLEIERNIKTSDAVNNFGDVSIEIVQKMIELGYHFDKIEIGFDLELWYDYQEYVKKDLVIDREITTLDDVVLMKLDNFRVYDEECSVSYIFDLEKMMPRFSRSYIVELDDFRKKLDSLGYGMEFGSVSDIKEDRDISNKVVINFKGRSKKRIKQKENVL